MTSDPPDWVGFFAEPAPSPDEVGRVRLPPRRRVRRSTVPQVEKEAGRPVTVLTEALDGSRSFALAEKAGERAKKAEVEELNHELLRARPSCSAPRTRPKMKRCFVNAEAKNIGASKRTSAAIGACAGTSAWSATSRASVCRMILGHEFEAAWRAAVAGQPCPLHQVYLVRGVEPRAARSGGWSASISPAPAFLDNRASTQRPRRTLLEKARRGSWVDGHRGHHPVRDPGQHERPPRDDPHGERVADDRVQHVRLGRPRSTWRTPRQAASAPILENNPCELVKRFQEPKKDGLDEEEGRSPHMVGRGSGTYSRPLLSPWRLRAADLRGAALHRLEGGSDGARVGRQHVKDDVLRPEGSRRRTRGSRWGFCRASSTAGGRAERPRHPELAWITPGGPARRWTRIISVVFSARPVGSVGAIGLDRSGAGARAMSRRRPGATSRRERAPSSSRRSSAGRRPRWSTSTRSSLNPRQAARSGRWMTLFWTGLPPPLFWVGARLSKRE